MTIYEERRKIREALRYKLDQTDRLIRAQIGRFWLHIRLKRKPSGKYEEWLKVYKRIYNFPISRLKLPDGYVISLPLLSETLGSVKTQKGKIKLRLKKTPELRTFTNEWLLSRLDSVWKEVYEDYIKLGKEIERLKPVVELEIAIPPYKFMMRGDWGYTMRVEAPTEYTPKAGRMIGDYSYAAKLRTISLIGAMGIAPAYFDDHRWESLTGDEIESYRRAGNPLPKRLRKLVRDYTNKIKVRRIKSNERSLYTVNLSGYSMRLPSELDLEEIMTRARARGYGVKRLGSLK